jgi:hypothetical protein
MVDQTVWRSAVKAVCVLVLMAHATPSRGQFSNEWWGVVRVRGLQGVPRRDGVGRLVLNGPFLDGLLLA